MKTSKKIIIPFFSTIVGLSLAAGIGGAFAWYQYNSQATASFLGTSVADTGVLQVGWKTMEDTDHDSSTPDVEVMHWGKDFIQTGAAAKLTPVTFGQMEVENEGQADEKTNILPDKAYAYPEAGCGTGYEKDDSIKKPGWVEAEAGKQYAQFDIYIRALVPDKNAQGDSNKQIAEGYKLAARNVFLSDFVCKSVDGSQVVEEALRIHLDVEDQDNRLLSNTAANLPLYGKLDLDADGQKDKVVVTPFRDAASYGLDENGNPYQAGDEIVYGNPGDRQVTEALSALKQDRDNDGKMPSSTDPEFSKKLLTTSTSDAVKVTVTIWLEGWEYLKVGEENNADVKSQIWNPKYTADKEVQVALQFDSGIFRGDDLNQQ